MSKHNRGHLPNCWPYEKPAEKLSLRKAGRLSQEFEYKHRTEMLSGFRSRKRWGHRAWREAKR